MPNGVPLGKPWELLTNVRLSQKSNTTCSPSPSCLCPSSSHPSPETTSPIVALLFSFYFAVLISAATLPHLPLRPLLHQLRLRDVWHVSRNASLVMRSLFTETEMYMGANLFALALLRRVHLASLRCVVVCVVNSPSCPRHVTAQWPESSKAVSPSNVSDTRIHWSGGQYASQVGLAPVFCTYITGHLTPQLQATTPLSWAHFPKVQQRCRGLADRWNVADARIQQSQRLCAPSRRVYAMSTSPATPAATTREDSLFGRSWQQPHHHLTRPSVRPMYLSVHYGRRHVLARLLFKPELGVHATSTSLATPTVEDRKARCILGIHLGRV